MNDFKKLRAGLFAAAGVYLIYTAYSLFKDRHTDASMPLWLAYVFTVFFFAAAIVVFVYAYKQWQKAKAEEAELERQIKEEQAEQSRQHSETGNEAANGPDGKNEG